MDPYRVYAENILSDRRGKRELLRDRHVDMLYAQYPELQTLDREIRIATAELLLAIAEHPDQGIERDTIIALQMERQEFLKQRKISEDYDRIQPFCKKCDDSGYVDGKPCSCLTELMIPRYIELSGISCYKDISFANHRPECFGDPVRINKIYQISVAFSRQIPAKPANLLFWGNPGTGKTFMAVSIAREAVLRGVITGIFRITELLELMTEYRTLMNSFSPDADRLRELKEKRELLLDAELIIIDELGVEPRSQNTVADLLCVLGNRKQKGLSTVITTNLSPADLQKTYDNRLYSRLFGDFDPIRFDGPDLRTKRRIDASDRRNQ